MRKHFDVAENETLLICIESPLDAWLINEKQEAFAQAVERDDSLT